MSLKEAHQPSVLKGKVREQEEPERLQSGHHLEEAAFSY